MREPQGRHGGDRNRAAIGRGQREQCAARFDTGAGGRLGVVSPSNPVSSVEFAGSPLPISGLANPLSAAITAAAAGDERRLRVFRRGVADAGEAFEGRPPEYADGNQEG